MGNFLILFFSFVLFAVGLLVPKEWLAMMVSDNGELIIPVSSGGDDPFLIKLALASYVISFLYSGLCLFLKRGVQYIFRVYVANGLAYVFFMFLVSIDSSIFEAAKFGNWVPVILSTFWLITVVVIIWASLYKLSNSDVVAAGS